MLCWKQRETTGKSHAHHALIDTIEAHKPAEAAELMKHHMLDLLSGLDLTRGRPKPERRADLLR
ncbi:hypothetical protein MesoLjLb_57520 [Mesorhizobium sp. L-8-3]|nr:hypothetical protein MesoLjLb_57520 [Mesorhizobium sp. L-8-3]